MDEFQQLEQSAIGQFVGSNGINYLILPDGRIMEPGGDTIYSSGVAQQMGLDLENYKVQGENPDGSFYTKYNIPSQISGVYQTTDPNILGYSPPDAGITAVPQVQEQTQVVQEADKTLAETLFPQGEFLDIRETATSPTEYNIEATKDLVENLPGIVQPFAPAAAGIMSLPYDAIQAYQRMQPGSGIGGFIKAYQAERPLQSAYERFVGASGPLAENINQAVSTLNPFQQRQYMQYATQNPEQARAAAERTQQFVQARGGNQ